MSTRRRPGADPVRPAEPDTRSATRFLLWSARRGAGPLLGASALGVLWLGSQALVTVVVREAVDHGLVPGDGAVVAGWAGVLLGLGVVQAGSGAARRRLNLHNALSAGFRTVRLVVAHTDRLGAQASGRVRDGDLVAVGTADAAAIGAAFDVVGRLAGAVVSVVLVTAVLVAQAPGLGLLLVAGTPVVVLLAGFPLRPLHRRGRDYRDRQGELAARLTDLVAGLRVLRGIGGEDVVAAAHRTRSQQVLAAGHRVAGAEAMIRSSQVLLPGLLVAAVTWIGARAAVAGELTAGELVAFYVGAAFLVEPLAVLIEAAGRTVRAHVAARRVVAVLTQPLPVRSAGPEPTAGGPVDLGSGLVVRPGELVGVLVEDVDVPGLLARIDALAARCRPDPDTAGDPTAEPGGVLRLDPSDRLLRGPLRISLDPHGRAGPGELDAALHVVAARDVVAALPAGQATAVTADGRRFSGGQRQRLLLARAVLADPAVLVVTDPTSAVDAHTEAVIAGRLPAARAGRTTVLLNPGPLLVERCDRVAVLGRGRLLADGTPAALAVHSPTYRAALARRTGDPQAAEPDPAATSVTESAVEPVAESAGGPAPGPTPQRR